MSKKENQSKHFLAHIPSTDPNATLVVEYEVRARVVLQTSTYGVRTLPTLFFLSKLQMEFAKIQDLDLVSGVLFAPADVTAKNACYLNVANCSALAISVMNQEARR